MTTPVIRPAGPRRLAVAALVLLLCAIVWASLQPGLAPPGRYQADKFLHAGAFVALSALAVVAWPGIRRLVAIQVGLAGFGAAIEIAQGLMPGRQGSLVDWAADLAGLALGMVLVRAARRLAPGSPSRPSA